MSISVGQLIELARKDERGRIVALLATPEAADGAARAVRRDKFTRTSAIRSFDETVVPTKQELDDARAACSALAEMIANTKE